MTNVNQFADRFRHLTGFAPLSWQTRLYARLAQPAEEWPSVIDVPTGLGKTMVMAIWWIAREAGLSVPTRLVYVVDRRTVVDQATTLAILLRQKLGDKLAVSTLRGELADNREWSHDLSRPAIIIGTVDLVGSALLFSGYRSGYKRRPVEAGLLGQDSLLVLDEAHLSCAFEKLISSIASFQFSNRNPMRVMRMSATSSDQDGRVFALELRPQDPNYDLWTRTENGKEQNPIRVRYQATKQLRIERSDNVVASIASAAARIATAQPGSRTVIFVRSPGDVASVRKELLRIDKSSDTRIAQLTGTMRGLERDELFTPPDAQGQFERRIMQRFLAPENEPSEGACFLISTSAGEVGFDLNADHLVGDEAPLDSWIQRLGRVNRRGSGSATAVLVATTGSDAETEFQKASVAATALFHDRMDVSPMGLKELLESLRPEQRLEASSPPPVTRELTDMLLDAWSLTSIVSPMPGRPPVAPWLRGIESVQPQTSIAWRAELDVPGFQEMDAEAVEDWFEAHRILTHESLSVPTNFAAKQLIARWNSLLPTAQASTGNATVIVDRAGKRIVRVSDFIATLAREDKQSSKGYESIRNAEVILPASFGGIERGKGLLDSDAPRSTGREGRQLGGDLPDAQVRLPAGPDVADVAVARERIRGLVTTVEGEAAAPVPIAATPQIGLAEIMRSQRFSRYSIDLDPGLATRVQLMSYVSKRERLDYGAAKESLESHVSTVVTRARRLIDRIGAGISAAERQAIEFAVAWHDHGKNREFMQRILGGVRTDSGRPWLEGTLGKSGGQGFGRVPRGYRHEFGSLREFSDAYSGKLSEDVFDLAMHLIATHHGRGRPHFPNGGFDPDCEDRTPELHADVIRRFARLQRKYGWWQLAWLENILRGADAMASAPGQTDDVSTESLT